MDVGVIESGLNVIFIIWFFMYGKEVGSIIGKKGELVKRICEESGVWINILEGNCLERIIILIGFINVIFKVFVMIIDKLEEDINSFMINSIVVSRFLVILRLVVLVI